MTDITYDAEADAVYVATGRGKVQRTEEVGPFIYDVDADGRVLGIEILSASKLLAPGDWKKAGPPKAAQVSAAEQRPTPNRRCRPLRSGTSRISSFRISHRITNGLAGTSVAVEIHTLLVS